MRAELFQDAEGTSPAAQKLCARNWVLNMRISLNCGSLESRTPAPFPVPRLETRCQYGGRTGWGIVAFEGVILCLEVRHLLHVQSFSLYRQNSHDLRVDGITFTLREAYEKLAGVLMSVRDLSLAPRWPNFPLAARCWICRASPQQPWLPVLPVTVCHSPSQRVIHRS